MAKFILPKSFLTQLKEFSGQGFCLLNINAEGNIDVIFEVDNEVAALALVAKMQNVGAALEDAIRNDDAKNATDEETS